MSFRTSEYFDKIFEAFSATAKGSYIYLCDMWTDMSRWSKSAVDYFGLPGEYMEDAGTIWAQHIHPEDRRRYQEDIDAVFSGRKKNHELEYRAMDKNGNYVVCTCSGVVIEDEAGNPEFFAGTITNRGTIENIDPTTNLYNLYEFLNALRLLRERGKKYRVLLVGFKHFSDVNDLYGYSFGNEAMKLFVSIMQNDLMDKGKIFRMDGTRFAVLTTELRVDDLKNYYLRLQEKAKNHLTVQENNVSLALCGGLVVVEDCQISEHAIHAAARYALNVSKNERHGELWIVENDDVDKNKKTVELINVLRSSIIEECSGFYLCYQPVVSPQTGKMTGAEALLRWNREPYGEISPGQFIPWLEKDSAFFDLGNYVLRQAMLDGKEFLKDHPDMIINVNLSYAQLERSEFRNTLVGFLLSTGFPPEHLCLELTERCRLLDMNFLRNEIIFLKSYGIKIALDDFGTGFSSLNLLRELPIDYIKIDRGFVSEIENNKADQSIVKAVMTCARELDIGVCVEGIENERLRDYLQNYPAQGYQGYYYSRPVTKEEFKRLELYK
ncbi:MAG: EAL domain-containing protein [Lachnospiraceae bacterium]|nr:EAL domain-containing protein [Lachnospiraceae bacterium]